VSAATVEQNAPAAAEPKRPGLYSRLSVPGASVTHHERWVSVDALRAIAALMVLVSHAGLLALAEPTGLAKHLSRLGVGVWIFFAASGYLIAGPFLRSLLDGRQMPPAGRYALRRSVRILPAYWVALAAILLLVTGSSLTHWWQLPVHALLLQGLVPGELKSFYLVAWSLAVEAMFYVLVPVFALGARRLARGNALSLDRLVAGILTLWAAAVAISLALAVAFPYGPGQHLPGGIQVAVLVGSLANFIPGMLVFLASLAAEDPSSRGARWYMAVASRPLPTLIVAAVLFLAATQLPFLTSHVAAAAQGPLFGIASGLVLSTFVHGKWRRLAPVLGPIGLASYGVYLWHWVILSTLIHDKVSIVSGFGIPQTAIRVAILMGLTIPVAGLSWLLIERPLLRRTAGWEQRSKARMAAKPRRDDASPAAAGQPQQPLPASSRP
jgi:peptidoglycan/LPS O-acetylase OafA/YrhL